MSNIQEYKTPKLAILEQQKKLVAYSETERNTITYKLIEKLLNLLGVSDGKIEQHKKLLGFINDVYGYVTYEEIDEAFKLYISLKFGIKPYQQLNAVVFGQVMREYDIYKKEQLKEYRRKQKELNNQKSTVSDQEKKRIDNEIVNKCLDYFIENRFVDIERLYVYDILYADNWLPTNNEYKKRIYKDAVDLLKIEYSRIKPINIDEKREIKNNLKSLLNPRESKAIVKSKELVLSEFLRKLTRDEKKLNEFKLKYK